MFYKDFGTIVFIPKDELPHPKSGRITQREMDAAVNLPLYFENSIVLNVAEGKKDRVEKSYILFDMYDDIDGTHVTRTVVNHYQDDDAYTSGALEDRLYSAKQKKEEVRSVDPSARSKNSLQPSSSEVTVTQLLYAIKRTYPDQLTLVWD